MKRPPQPTYGNWASLACILALLISTQVNALQIFSAGPYSVPETISLAPSGFGAFGGSYFIPDAGTSNIWVVPNGGGSPTPFLAVPIEPIGNNIISGMFLPSGWGDDSGKFLVASTNGPNLLFDSAGTMTTFDALTTGAFTTPLIAPSFGPYVGNLFVTDQNGVVVRADPAGGGLTIFSDLRGGPFTGGPFGIELTPSSFGSFANRLMISDASGGSIAAVAANGAFSIFTTVPLDLGQTGLRQMLMAPDDYFLDALGIPGQVLLVSVAGSDFGGGTLGAVLALDSLGNIAAHLKVGSVLEKFDPRGIVFTSDGDLLISDTSDPIYRASALDFAVGREDLAVPEPATLALLSIGLAVLGFGRRPRESSVR